MAAMQVALSYVEQSQNSSNKQGPWCEHSSQLLTDAALQRPLGSSPHALTGPEEDRRIAGCRIISLQHLSEPRQAYTVTVDRLGNVGLSVVVITTISILIPYHCEILKSILNFLNIHSFHWLCCASWNFISVWAPEGIESAQTAPDFE